MTSSIKPPQGPGNIKPVQPAEGQGPGKVKGAEFGEHLQGTRSKEATHAVEGNDLLQVAEQHRAGQLSRDEAIALILEKAVAKTAPEGISEARRSGLKDFLKERLDEDPALMNLLRKLDLSNE